MKEDKNLKLFLLLVTVGFAGWWIAKHTRKGSVIVAPLDPGVFVPDVARSMSTGQTISQGAKGSTGSQVAQVGPFRVSYNSVGNNIINGVPAKIGLPNCG